MKKLVTEMKTREIDACDLCENDCSNGFHNRCFLCQRQTCLRCSRGLYFRTDKDKRLLDFHLTVCHECEAIGNNTLPDESHADLFLIERITATMDGADRKVRELVDQWRALAKLRAKS